MCICVEGKVMKDDWTWKEKFYVFIIMDSKFKLNWMSFP